MKIIVVAGARPNFPKIAPILKEIEKRKLSRPDISVLLVHTGQHYDQKMSGGFFEELGIPEPDINLEVGSGSHAQQTGKVMMAFEETCLEQKPDWVLVVGDVNSTLACALTAKKLNIQVAHVEAGLRSRDMQMPEEINRLCTDVIADLLFTTDLGAGANLRAEGIAPERIQFVGNTMIDTLLQQIEAARAKPLPEGVQPAQFAVLTLHRPSNVDARDTLQPLFGAINDIAARIPIVFPAHPRTQRNLKDIEVHPAIRVIEPLSYLNFIGLVANSRMVLTDSGGIQEETTVLGIPCLTLRKNTERPITCEVGTNRLVGTDPDRIRSEAFRVLDNEPPRTMIPDRWDGRASERIAAVIIDGNSFPG